MLADVCVCACVSEGCCMGASTALMLMPVMLH